RRDGRIVEVDDRVAPLTPNRHLVERGDRRLSFTHVLPFPAHAVAPTPPSSAPAGTARQLRSIFLRWILHCIECSSALGPRTAIRRLQGLDGAIAAFAASHGTLKPAPQQTSNLLLEHFEARRNASAIDPWNPCNPWCEIHLTTDCTDDTETDLQKRPLRGVQRNSSAW